LLDWIDEMPIDSIREKYINYYDDGDILTLGEYAAITLQKVSFFIKDKRIRLIETLIHRLRCGVKADIVRSGFTKLTVVARDKARPLARALANNGYRNLAQLSRVSPAKLAEKLGINEEQAASIIADAKQLIRH
jgi:replicative superfamily II helicase